MTTAGIHPQHVNSTITLGVYGLKKVVRGRTLVQDVTFEVNPGEIFGFLGPNGAGKTTTIRMLVGLIRPTEGTIVIDGHNLRTHPLDAMRRVGCIVENPDLYPYLTGHENLLQLARMQGPEAVARIHEVAELVHLADRLGDKVGTYSLGMRQRLGIAQALLGQPRLLILDEPTNGLDPAGIRELRNFLRGLAESGLAVFISSHLLAEIELLCDTVAIIRNGVVIRRGRVADLLASTEVEWRVQPAATAQSTLAGYDSGLTVVGGFTHSDDEAVFRCRLSDAQVADASAALIAAGCRIFEVIRRKASLEDVFLQTTGGDDA